MKIYVDEDLASPLLITLLQKAGHDIDSPVNSGLMARSDAVQLTQAIRNKRVALSKNYKDFEELHVLVGESQGVHSGILVVRNENDPKRDMNEKGIVTAIRKLEAASVPIANEYIMLNHWR